MFFSKSFFRIFNIFWEKCINTLWYSTKHQFHTYTVFSEYGKKLLNIKVLPADIKVTKSLQSFKYKFKNYLLQSWNNGINMFDNDN